MVREAFSKLDLAAATPWSAPVTTGTPPVWSADAPQVDQILSGLPGSANPLVAPDPKALDKPAAWKVADAPPAGTVAVTLAGAVLPLPGTAPQAGAVADWLLPADICIESGGVAGIAAEWRDADDCTLVALDTANTAARLVNVAAGKVSVLQPSAIPALSVGWQRLAVRVCERHLTVWSDGVLVVTASLTADRTGGLALFASGAKLARFRNVVLLELTERVGGWRTRPANWLPPATPAGSRTGLWLRQGQLSAVDAPLTGGQLALIGEPWWDNCVVTARLRLYSGAKVAVLAGWQDTAHHVAVEVDAISAQVQVDGVPVKGGAWQGNAFAATAACEVRILIAGSHLRVDLHGWTVETELSTPAGGRCGIRLVGGSAAWLDTFEVRPATPADLATWNTASGGPNLAGWAVEASSGLKDGPAQWQRSGKAIVQTSPAWVDQAKATVAVPEFAQRGTVLWAGAEFSAGLRLSADISSDSPAGALGVQLGASPDDSAWLRFSYDQPHKCWRVVRKQAGAFEQLWSQGATLPPGATARLALAQDGDGIHGWIDGIPAFWLPAIGESLPRVGLYCSANPTARFSNLQIVPGPWRREGQLLLDRFA